MASLGLYLVMLAAASIGQRTVRSAQPPLRKLRFAVVVPAHDEELLVGRCIRSLLDQSHPADLVRVIVVADNCADATACVARDAGAEVMIRDVPEARGKGYALRWAMDRLLNEPGAPDAVVVVDADSVAERDFLSALAAELESGHEVIQGDYSLLHEPGQRREEMVEVGFLLFHRVRFRGRARLGMPVNLVGNGMAFSTGLLRRQPWNAFTGAEDLEQSVQLRLAGVRPHFAPAARVAGPGPASGRGAVRQRLRWEGGRFYIVRDQLARLIGAAIVRRQPRLLDAAIDLATPPLALLSLAAVGGGLLSFASTITGMTPPWTPLPWVVALVTVPAFVVIGLWSAGVPRKTWLVLLRGPLFIGWKAVTYVRLLRSHDVHRWDRTDRLAS